MRIQDKTRGDEANQFDDGTGDDLQQTINEIVFPFLAGEHRQKPLPQQRETRDLYQSAQDADNQKFKLHDGVIIPDERPLNIAPNLKKADKHEAQGVKSTFRKNIPMQALQETSGHGAQ